MGSNVVVREATVLDVLFIGQHMRDVDKREIWASHRAFPLPVVSACYLQKVCLCGLVDGVPTVLFGCADNNGFGVPWMLATDDIEKIGVKFILGSKDYVLKWIDQYKYLTNYVHAENAISIRWLKWLGFEMKEKATINGEPFIKFEMEGS